MSFATSFFLLYLATLAVDVVIFTLAFIYDFFHGHLGKPIWSKLTDDQKQKFLAAMFMPGLNTGVTILFIVAVTLSIFKYLFFITPK